MDEQATGSESAGRGPLRHIPNGISSLRLLIALIFPFSPESSHLPLIIAGLLSEFFDGFLARTFKWTSYLGQVLDPVADKFFLFSVSITWVLLGKLTVLQWLLLAVRDFGVMFMVLALLAMGRLKSTRSVKARLPSKLTTTLQYLVFLLVLTDNLEYLGPLAWITAAFGLAASIQYGYLLRHAFAPGRD